MDSQLPLPQADADPTLQRLDEAVSYLQQLPELIERAHELAWWPPGNPGDLGRGGSGGGDAAPKPGDPRALDDYRYSAHVLTGCARNLHDIIERRTPAPGEVIAAVRSLQAGAERLAELLAEGTAPPAARRGADAICRAVEQSHRALRRAVGARERRSVRPHLPARPARRSRA